jgi:hypothetical protein
VDDQWNEKLSCPRCQNTGMVSLTQAEGTYVPVDAMPGGFKVVKTEFGINFECEVCAVAVAS